MAVQELVVGLAQRAPLPIDKSLPVFQEDVARTINRFGRIDMLVYPEMHLHGSEHLPAEERESAREEAAVPLEDDFVSQIGQIAADHGIWLCPGSIGERDSEGRFFNTQLLFGPDGTLMASYRKMFPWRPFEPHQPGTEFVVAPVSGFGAVGLSNCYDAWFPEHSRHLAWMGSAAILNVVKTTSQDREQELVLARANAIVNQVYMLSVNCAEPVGRGRSIAVDPEGMVLGEAALGEDTIVVRLDPAKVQRVRSNGTAGTNRVWSQLQADDAPIPLPLYGGTLDPSRWSPHASKRNS